MDMKGSNDSSRRDQLFAGGERVPGDFEFDERVAEVFDDMVVRSVPHYLEVQQTTVDLCSKLYQAGTYIYDLGCSTGSTLYMLERALTSADVRLIGVDSSPAMLERCRRRLGPALESGRVELVQARAETLGYRSASVIVLHYTLQFIPIKERLLLLERLWHALVPGGALLLSEKLAFKSSKIEGLMTDLYYRFKVCNGYSEHEVEQKRRALNGVLVPLSEEQNREMLCTAGFHEVEVYLKRYNVASFLALKQ